MTHLKKYATEYPFYSAFSIPSALSLFSDYQKLRPKSYTLF